MGGSRAACRVLLEAQRRGARDALRRQDEHGVGEASDPRRNVVPYECQLCGRTEFDTGRGAIEIGDGAAATLGCGATELDLRTEGRVVKRRGWHPDALCSATGMSYGEVSGALLTLVLAGCVEETFSHYRALTGALP